MERFNTCDLREKEVINLCNGARLGCPTDFEFCSCDGRISALVVSGQGGLFGFGQRNDLVIPWSKIECIGEGTILVKLTPSECTVFDDGKRKKRKSPW